MNYSTSSPRRTTSWSSYFCAQAVRKYSVLHKLGYSSISLPISPTSQIPHTPLSLFFFFFCVASVVQLLSFGTKLRRRSLHGVNRTLYVPALAPHCVGFHLNDCTPFLLCRSSCCTAEHLSPWVLPSSVREDTRSYFLGLFSRQQREPVAKPWLATPSVAEVRSRLQQAPFQ